MFSIKKFFLNFFEILKSKKQKEPRVPHQYDWDVVEFRYNESTTKWNLEKTPKILELIQKMREKGYDGKLFPYVSLFDLNLRNNSTQRGITINYPAAGMRVSGMQKGLLLEHPCIEYCPELEAILNELADTDA